MACPRLPVEVIERICRILCDVSEATHVNSPHFLPNKQYRSSTQQLDLASFALVDKTWRQAAQPVFDEYLLLVGSSLGVFVQKALRFLAGFPAGRRGRIRQIRVSPPARGDVVVLHKTIDTIFKSLPALRSLVIGSSDDFPMDPFWNYVLSRAPTTVTSLTFLRAKHLGGDLGITTDAFSHLEELHIYGCPHLHPDLFASVMSGFPALRTLEVTGCILECRVQGASEASWWEGLPKPTCVHLEHLRFGCWDQLHTRRSWACPALLPLLKACATELRTLVLEGSEYLSCVVVPCLDDNHGALARLEVLVCNATIYWLPHCLHLLERGRFLRLQHLCAPDDPAYYLQIQRIVADRVCPALTSITLLQNPHSNPFAGALLHNALQRAGSQITLRYEEPGSCGLMTF